MKKGFQSRTYSAYRRKRKRNTFLRSVVIVTVIFLIVLSFGLFSKSKTDKKDPDTVNLTADTENVVSNPATMILTDVPFDTKVSTETVTSETVASTEAMPENSTEFEDIIARAGYTADELGFSQLITVDAVDSYATVNAFEKIDGVWVKAQILTEVSGCVGTQGVSVNASEYASYTPKGLFSLSTGFGICDDPGTGLDYFKVTEDSYWVDDVNSKYYNQHVEGTEDKDWNSAEHLVEYPRAYDYCVFIEYNTNPVVPGKGSAFFLHVGTSPTAGCVAIPESDMIDALRWLDKTQNPHILIF